MAKTMTTVRHKDSKSRISKPSAKYTPKTKTKTKSSVNSKYEDDVSKRLELYRKITKKVTFA